MDLPFLPTPVSKCDTRTGAQFTVRSANSPSYSFTRRPGVRRSKGFIEEVREGTEGDEERERRGTDPYTNGTNKEEDGVSQYQDSTGGRSSVKGQREEKETLDHETSTKLNQNGTGDKTTTESGTDRSENPAFESRGRTEWRRYNLSGRSKSVDLGAEAKSPVRGTRADMLSTSRGGDVTKQLGGLDERRTGAEAVRNRVMSSTHTYSSAGRTNVVQERSPVSHLSQTLVRVSKGHSLPSRLRSQSGPSSRFTETASSLGPKGGQSIMERIEKLYGSTGVSKAEDNSKIRDFSTSATSADSFISSHRSYERGAGGTFPRGFSLGEKNSLSPMQSIRSSPWTPQKDTSGSESSLSPGRSRRLSGGLWQGPVQGRYPPEGGANLGKGLVDIGTMSLDRARSRNTVAAQIRSARAAAGFTAPTPFLEEETSAALKDSSGFTERGMNGKCDQGWVNDGKETNGVKGIKEKTELKSSTDEDVFESSPNKTTPKKNFSAPASVRNKISQFEALTQRAQGLATGHILMPRRAFSVPTQLSRGHDGVKKSGSAKAIGGLRDKWEDLKEGGEAPNKPDDKGTGAGKKLLLERFLSADGVGLERKEKGGVDLAESERIADSGDNLSEDFGKYSKLKSSLEIPLNGGRRKTFFIDETDFAKVSSPEEASEKDMTANNTPTLLLSNSSDISTNVASSPVSDDGETPTNTPNHSPVNSPTAEPEKTSPIANRHDSTSATKSPDPDSSPPPRPLATSSHSNLLDLVSSEVTTAQQRGRKPVLDLDSWVAGLNSAIKVWNDDGDYEDDDESTQKDEDSNYDSDSGESSVTVTSQSDNRSFCVSLSELCNFAGVDCESDNDSDEWQSRGRRSASLSSDVSALSCVSVMPSEELDRLLEDVRSLGDNTLQDYDDVQVAVLHKEVGVGLGFSVAGGVDQSKPVTVHRVFHPGVASKEGSIMEGDQVLSINGTALNGYTHWEVLRVLRRAKARETGVVVLRRGGISDVSKSGVQTSTPGPTQTQFTDDGQHMCVCLEKNSRDLGFSLEGGVGSSLGNRPLTVQKIFQGGPVDKVCPGDEILEIEGVSVVGMRRLEAWTLIRKLPSGTVDVVLSRPLKHLET
ncbi:uncharacterized protein si:dkey-92i15.4 [Hippoglossus hippoglossus]|uniref:uncharacterized protein si:dkey-92i15.4 n=1 Tax=Hippoglossus hippoglossus TaxID=8267 RepID=UPI00148D6875|nr:uncharacterized protein si:dkey-92i15.4 [Hippoglossus hippoglossus]XP_034466862.1 uncharacterized protein si:dkey-92i15.4 [Hippoglossus hippoglossus]XP_034466863.1 uncharacterized protein si:dkey-92i15.4 [Hippoglossus hippoglossus]XP_034466864.1 uncharacterized protein si:dkey-92i15.4 [Hippoglossus hippoglossus]